MSIDDDGRIQITDDNGNDLPPKILRSFKARPEVRQAVAEQCEQWNKGIDEIRSIHHRTSAPNQGPTHSPEPFTTSRPAMPIPIKLGFLAKIFRRRRERIERTNAQSQRDWLEAVAEWEASLREHQRVENERELRIKRLNQGDLAAMEELQKPLVSTEFR